MSLDDVQSDDGQWSDENFIDTPQTPRQQFEELPPSSGPRRSSPIIGSPGEIRRIRTRKAQRRRHETLDKNIRTQREQARTLRHAALEDVLDTLHSKNLKLWDLLEYIFNPAHQQGSIRYNEFFVTQGNPTKILEWWLSPLNRGKKAKEEIKEWIGNYAAKVASQEARAVTASKIFQTADIILDAQTVKAFDLQSINKMLSEDSSAGAPFTMRILKSFSTSRHAKKHSETRKKRTDMVRKLLRLLSCSTIDWEIHSAHTGDNFCGLDVSGGI